MTQLFNRHIKVTFVEPGLVVGGHIEFNHPVQHTHEIQIDIKAELNKYPNKAILRILNLDIGQRNRIKKELITVIVEAGYANPNGPSILDIVYIGKTLSVASIRKGNDTITHVECGDGQQGYRYARVNTQFGKGNNAPADIIRHCANQLAAEGVPTRILKDLPTQTMPRSIHVHGSARDTLTETCRNSDMEWQIVHGKLEVFPKDQLSVPDTPVLISPDTGMIESPRETETGIKVQCLMMPRVRPGRLIAVQSSLYSSIKLFRVEQYTHSGSVYGASLGTTIQARLYEGSAKRNVERLRGPIAI